MRTIVAVHAQDVPVQPHLDEIHDPLLDADLTLFEILLEVQYDADLLLVIRLVLAIARVVGLAHHSFFVFEVKARVLQEFLEYAGQNLLSVILVVCRGKTIGDLEQLLKLVVDRVVTRTVIFPNKKGASCLPEFLGWVGAGAVPAIDSYFRPNLGRARKAPVLGRIPGNPGLICINKTAAIFLLPHRFADPDLKTYEKLYFRS